MSSRPPKPSSYSRPVVKPGLRVFEKEADMPIDPPSPNDIDVMCLNC